jgi:hypothetical protein
MDATRKNRSRGDVRVGANDAIVIDDGARIHDGIATNAASWLKDGSRHDLDSVFNFQLSSDDRRRMDDSGKAIAFSGEAIVNIPPINRGCCGPHTIHEAHISWRMKQYRSVGADTINPEQRGSCWDQINESENASTAKQEHVDENLGMSASSNNDDRNFQLVHDSVTASGSS